MAGIEKICEYSDEYPGWLMYGYKRNHIQIMSKYRKLFRGADHTLHIFKPKLVWQFKNGGQMDYDTKECNFYDPPLTVKEYEELESRFARKVKEYGYMLEVTDPELQGRVNGKYYNFTTDLISVKRRLKRLLRQPLNIVEHDISVCEFIRSNQ